MPSDNLEKYFKEHIQSVEHTLPPGSTWNPEATWLKLQYTPTPVRKKSGTWLYYAAAVFVFALLSGIAQQYWLPAPVINNPVTATAPAAEISPALVRPEPVAKSSNQSKTSIISSPVNPKQFNPTVATGQKKKVRAGAPVISRANTQPKQPHENPEITETLVAKKEVISTSNPPDFAPEGTTTTTTTTTTKATPIKITVVLGANSSARISHAPADKNLPDKRRKNRFRMTVPEAVSLDKTHFAVTDSSDKPLRLQAKIDL